MDYLDAGASHVIVTSFVFREGQLEQERLQQLVRRQKQQQQQLLQGRRRRRHPRHTPAARALMRARSCAALQVKLVGRRRLVLDLSCRQRDGQYWVVTDRWQRFSSLALSEASLAQLAASCDEFLVHGVDVEGLQLGIDDELVTLLARWSPIPVTYAGGARTLVSTAALLSPHPTRRHSMHMAAGIAVTTCQPQLLMHLHMTVRCCCCAPAVRPAGVCRPTWSASLLLAKGASTSRSAARSTYSAASWRTLMSLRGTTASSGWWRRHSNERDASQ